MSIYLIHSSLFNRNQFRVLIVWCDFIHRCFVHSRWSCQNQPTSRSRKTNSCGNTTTLHQMVIVLENDVTSIPSLDLHTSFHSTSFNDHWIFIAYSVCLFQTPYHHSLVIDLGSNHPLTRFHHLITTQIDLASMFQSFVWSMLRMIIRNIWEIKDRNWENRVWFNDQNRNVLFLIIL